MKRTLIAVALFTALSTSAMASDNTWKDDAKDAWIDGKAEATLLFNTKLNSFDINTDVIDGKVVLTGKVESDVEKALAEELISGIDGVTEVENSLTVLNTDMDDMDKKSHTAMKKGMDHKDDMKDRSHSVMNKDMDDMDEMDDMDDMDEIDDNDEGSVMADAKISTIVKGRLLLESETSGTSIDVDVDNRVVTLKGTVKSEAERDLVVSIAENTDDVDSVNDELTIEREMN